MPGILTRLNARRHSRGFGIHSPFAFEFVTAVLCQRRHYYAYEWLPRDSRMRLLHRLVIAFRPESAAVLCADATLWWPAIKSAANTCDANADTPDFVVADAKEHSAAELLLYIDAGAHMMIINGRSSLLAEITAHMACRGRGMTFANGRGTIVVANHAHLPAQYFSVSF